MSPARWARLRERHRTRSRVTIMMPISGGHINPAGASPLAWQADRLAHAGQVRVGQLPRAIVGALFIRRSSPRRRAYDLAGTPQVAGNMTFGSATALEALFTFFLAARSTAPSSRRRRSASAGFAIGLVVLVCVLAEACSPALR